MFQQGVPDLNHHRVTQSHCIPLPVTTYEDQISICHLSTQQDEPIPPTNLCPYKRDQGKEREWLHVHFRKGQAPEP
jgi:hypothetical protein